MVVITVDRQAESLTAIEALMGKLRQIDSGIELTPQDAEWLQMFRTVHGKYARRIGQLDSWMLSCTTVWLCVREGVTNIAYECEKAHRDRLLPQRRKRNHLSIDDEGVDEPADDAEAIDDSVMEAMRSLGPDDEKLLRERYFGEGRSTKELAEEAGVTDATMRQRLARTKRKFEIAYERLHYRE